MKTRNTFILAQWFLHWVRRSRFSGSKKASWNM